MGDMKDYFLKAAQKQERNRYGVECPECKRLRPKTNASILLPGHVCKIDGYRDPRRRHD